MDAGIGCSSYAATFDGVNQLQLIRKELTFIFYSCGLSVLVEMHGSFYSNFFLVLFLLLLLVFFLRLLYARHMMRVWKSKLLSHLKGTDQGCGCGFTP